MFNLLVDWSIVFFGKVYLPTVDKQLVINLSYCNCIKSPFKTFGTFHRISLLTYSKQDFIEYTHTVCTTVCEFTLGTITLLNVILQCMQMYSIQGKILL